MKLLKSDASELDLFMTLRNDPESIRFSKRGKLSSNTILSDYFKNPKKSPFIIINSMNEKMGYAIFEWISKESCEISIAILKSFRGKGIGVEAIQVATDFCFQNYSEIEKIIAVILSANTVSIKAFEKAGYRFESEKNSMKTLIARRS